MIFFFFGGKVYSNEIPVTFDVCIEVHEVCIRRSRVRYESSRKRKKRMVERFNAPMILAMID